MLYRIKNTLLYKFHLLLNVKNKYLLIALLQILFVLCLTNLYDHTYCMTNENDSGSEISDISDISDLFYIDEAYIQHSVDPYLEHLTEKYRRQAEAVLSTSNPDITERSLAPIFEFLKTEDSQYVGDVTTFNTRSLPEKVSTLQRAYFTESIENSVLKDAISKQEEQLVSRHQDLINAKFTIKHLEKEIETLRKELEDLSTERK